MQIKQIMKNAVLLRPEMDRKAIMRVVKKNPDVALFMVVGKNKNFLGDIHENDLFLMMVPDDLYDDIGMEFAFDIEKKFFAKTAKEIMRKHDVTCFQEEDVMDVAKKFTKEEVNEMPVLGKKGQVVGVIDQGRILRHMKC